jgi:hypothetical protein
MCRKGQRIKALFVSMDNVIVLSMIRSPKDKSGVDQDLTLEDVCPVWFRKFQKGLERRDRSVLAGDSKYCLVGEAWGYTGKQAGYYIAPLIPFVGCWSCVRYGQKFGKVAKKEDRSVSDFEPLISEFLAHWNREHKGITRKIKR